MVGAWFHYIYKCESLILVLYFCMSDFGSCDWSKFYSFNIFLSRISVSWRSDVTSNKQKLNSPRYIWETGPKKNNKKTNNRSSTWMELLQTEAIRPLCYWKKNYHDHVENYQQITKQVVVLYAILQSFTHVVTRTINKYTSLLLYTRFFQILLESYIWRALQ